MWQSGATRADRVDHRFKWPRRQWHQRIPLDRGEHRRRGRTVQAAVLVGSVDLGGPPQAVALHVGQRGELAAREERVPNVGHRPLDARFVLRFSGPRRVDQGAVKRGEFAVGEVDLRVIQVRSRHPGFEVVAHQPRWHPAEELERRDVRGVPRLHRNDFRRATSRRAGHHSAGCCRAGQRSPNRLRQARHVVRPGFGAPRRGVGVRDDPVVLAGLVRPTGIEDGPVVVAPCTTEIVEPHRDQRSHPC